MNNKPSEYIYGLSSIISQLGGFLFLENVKMEKQRTNLSYNKIIPLYLKPKTFINGFFPYGIIQAFSKGFIFGFNQNYIKPYLNKYNFGSYNNQINNLLIGLSTGISESLITSPILYIRNNLNTSVTEKNNIKLNFNIKSIFKGCNILIAKRCIDWTTRFILIDIVKEKSPINNIVFNTFIGSSLSSIFSSPIDRLLPIVYSNKSIKDTLYTQKFNFFYKGFLFRFFSTGHYTCCILLLPNILSGNS